MKSQRFYRFVGVLTVLAFISASFVAVQSVQAGRRRPGEITDFPPLRTTSRLTIIAPHPDDETLALGGLIYEARQQNLPVSVIFMTNGDGNRQGAKSVGLGSDPASMLKLGHIRQQEALHALADLGVSSDSIYFLGLPDDGLDALMTPRYLNQVYTSPITGMSSTAGYDNSYVPNMPFTGVGVQNALLSALNASRPTRVFVTMGEDTHPDHRAAVVFLDRVRSRILSNPLRFRYLVHHEGFAVQQDKNAPLQPPADLAKVRFWDSIAISDAARRAKTTALNEYKSQLPSELPGYSITNFIAPNELVME